MATIKILSLRVKSMKNIQKIVKTMKIVSAAKYAKAKKELLVARPYGTGAKVFLDKLEIPPTEQMPERLLIAMTSDRGLCGATHKNITLKVKEECAKSPENTKIVCVGEKSRAMLQRQFGTNIVGVVNDIGRKSPTFLDASKLADIVIRSDYRFTSGKVIYNESKSVVSYTTTDFSIYSIQTVNSAPGIRKYEQEDELLQSYLEFTLAALLYFALKEGATSEQASRVNAMELASKTAGTMIGDLTLALNKTRQAAITTELNEIISGSIAAKKQV